eukprot:CAMPEP_0172538914 /NCGR_PEP_ID=MMETSP1067-20121228/10199_1 /TAXON_ID=265564 ORGANISM="Thalassiosira punctigera, Strain Tpunct2005C2" /NCGR_SAMPLE_ID=MMETSP1067 /ASSEMBLY_ACC=CAM_ASM_000444 /LENGTH=984 /DNA_ID=CAMNT_0013324507 /DNA_START=27 /DNA_END=2981 /DNA_ORIENTATION=-
MAAASPGSYHSSGTPSYYSTVRGGGGSYAPAPSPGGSSPGAAATFSAAASLVPPPPFAGSGPSSSDFRDDGGMGGPADDDVPGDVPNPGGNGGTLTSTPYLQSRLVQLRNQSQELSSELTKKLATSRSGQSLLHIGPSLSTLPPDLSSLLDALSPLLKEVQSYEADNRRELERIVTRGREVRRTVRKRKFAVECAEIYGDLLGAEEVLRSDVGRRIQEDYGVGSGRTRCKDGGGGAAGGRGMATEDELDDLSDDEEDGDEELDHASSLERAAYTTLHLLQELQSSSEEVSAIAMMSGGAVDASNDSDNANILPSLNDVNADGGINGVVMEKSRFLMKLAPRIRRLESDTAKCLAGRLESLLAKVRRLKEEEKDCDDEDDNGRQDSGRSKQLKEEQRRRVQQVLLLTISSCLRGLALLRRGPDAESAFARVAIMPILRSKLSMGKLDEGGSRGECAGLFFLLDDVATTVKEMYGPILRASEGMFANDNNGSKMELDLVTCGVWVPVATALMADPGIKMAIFSPGIANVLQANYSALDTFLSELAGNLLTQPPSNEAVGEEEEKTSHELGDFTHLYYKPDLNAESVERAQSRLYAHPTTVDYYRRWNLPIYYQLRFAEFCKRIDKAIEAVQKEGWQADVYTGDEAEGKKIHQAPGFELPLFVELYDALLSMWKSNVFLRPLTHRFLRGAVQLVGRVMTFVREGLEGRIEFGRSSSINIEKRSEGTDDDDDAAVEHVVEVPGYFWNERVEDVAVVAWELTILDTCMSHDYLDAVAATVCPPDEESRRSTRNSSAELNEMRALASEVLVESSLGISPLVSNSWNELIVDNLNTRCCAPLSAVKGVAATYRMTNRPPPTQASPFVSTVLRPLKEFDDAYASRTPPQIGDAWKRRVVESVSDKYSAAVEELIATVKRTEEALRGRKTRRTMAGGMSDGEKVKLQLYLDHREFRSRVAELGVDPEGIKGLVGLGELTKEAEALFLRTQQKK